MSKEIISPDDNHGFADIIDRYGWGVWCVPWGWHD